MRTLLSWSSGKDAAWALHRLRQDPQVEVVGLLSTMNEVVDRVAMHGVRRALLQAQAEATGLPCRTVGLPWPCDNETYQERMARALAEARAQGVQAIAFGDLHLDDVRAWREAMLEGTGLRPLFPLWGQAGDTRALARQMVDQGLRAVLVCVDEQQLSPAFLGRTFDHRLLDELPPQVDPCGEGGEFHTFCTAGPMLARRLPIRRGRRVQHGPFHHIDLRLR